MEIELVMTDITSGADTGIASGIASGIAHGDLLL